MNGWENEAYHLPLIISNVVALVFLLMAWKRPAWAEWAFILLFGWASYANTSQILDDPNTYLDFADMTFLPVYRDIILGPFASHIPLFVGFIALCQAFIAVGLFVGGRLGDIAGWGAITFLLAIFPLGVGSGFPCTLVFALAMFILLRSGQRLPVPRTAAD